MNETVRLIHRLADAAVGRVQKPPAIVTTDRSSVRVELHNIDEHGRLDLLPTPVGSQPYLKRWILRLAGFNWSRQSTVNHSTLLVLTTLIDELDHMSATIAQVDRRAVAASVAGTAEVDEMRRTSVTSREFRTITRDTDKHLSEVRTAVAAVEQLLLSTTQQVEELQAEWHAAQEHHATELADLQADFVAVSTKLLAQQRHTAALRTEIARARMNEVSPGHHDDADTSMPAAVPPDVTEMYARFERTFRPSNAVLTERFTDYLDVLDHLAGSAFPLIDIGAGRGEFVAVIAERGIRGIGIDINRDAVDEAVANGRSVELADAVSYLAELDDESVGAITAFHVIEHLDPGTTLRLLDECLRVLRPGGDLILETPNPTNLAVGAAAFYHDPTHLRPMTPTYLEFLVADRGFTDVTTRFLHAAPEYDLELITPTGKGAKATKMLLDDVRWALKGPQDFAVLARRPGGL